MKKLFVAFISCLVAFLLVGCNHDNTSTVQVDAKVEDNDAAVSGEIGINTDNDISATMIVSVSAENVVINNESNNFKSEYDTNAQDISETRIIDNTTIESAFIESNITETTTLSIQNDKEKNNTVTLTAYDSTDGYSELNYKIKIGGIEYTNIFLFDLSANAGLLGIKSQYALYNISDISDEYNKIHFNIGHIDSEKLVDIELKIFTNAINDEFGDCETYTISSDSMYVPISVDITQKDVLKIEISPLDGVTSYGIFDVSFE